MTEKLAKRTAELEKRNLVSCYENDKLEQYTRRDNLRIFGLEDDGDD